MRNIEDYATAYSLSGFEEYQVRYRRKMILEQIEKYKPTHILEIGCGLEPLCKYVKDVQFTIVEPSKEFCDNVEKNFRGGAFSPVIINGFFEESHQIDSLKNTFDMIICSSLLHEVEEPEKLLQAIVKKCNKNTLVHINVPNAKSVHRLLALESDIISGVKEMSKRNRVLQQNNVFDIDSLIKIAESNGLKVVEQGSYFVKPFTHSQMEAMLKEGIIDECILEGFYRITKYMPELGSEIYVNCLGDFNG